MIASADSSRDRGLVSSSRSILESESQQLVAKGCNEAGTTVGKRQLGLVSGRVKGLGGSL